eukprot:NODE_15_length_50561_cov_0.608081.p17 type:complete len:337 gc:universal NODE_15_length_50561_cov_0.608081:8632-7622(-)
MSNEQNYYQQPYAQTQQRPNAGQARPQKQQPRQSPPPAQYPPSYQNSPNLQQQPPQQYNYQPDTSYPPNMPIPESNQPQYNNYQANPNASPNMQQQQYPQNYAPQPSSYPNQYNQDSGQSPFNGNTLAAGLGTFNMAMNASNQYFKNSSRYIDVLRVYFRVNHQYVVYRLANILFPFKQIKIPNGNRVGSEFDLYIPLMTFITYILLVGLQTGLDGSKAIADGSKSKSTFHPDILGITASFTIFVYILQLLVLSLFLYLNNVGSYISWLDLAALIGYMFVGAVINGFITLLGFKGILGWTLRGYISVALAFFTVIKIYLAQSLAANNVCKSRSECC